MYIPEIISKHRKNVGTNALSIYLSSLENMYFYISNKSEG